MTRTDDGPDSVQNPGLDDDLGIELARRVEVIRSGEAGGRPRTWLVFESLAWLVVGFVLAAITVLFVP